MLTVKTIIPPTVDLYEADGTFLGTLNQYEFLDVRVQIKEHQLSGYFVVFKGEKIRIDKNGTLESYPNGMFDLIGNYLSKLI